MNRRRFSAALAALVAAPKALMAQKHEPEIRFQKESTIDDLKRGTGRKGRKILSGNPSEFKDGDEIVALRHRFIGEPVIGAEKTPDVFSFSLEVQDTHGKWHRISDEQGDDMLALFAPPLP